MEAVQPSVVHLDHGGMPPQSQMAYVQRNSALHNSIRSNAQTTDTSPYKSQRGSTVPSPVSPGARQATVYPSYQSGNAPVVTREAQAMRYVQPSPYSAPVPYRDVPSPYRSQTGAPEARSGTPQVEYVNLRGGERPRISLLPPAQEYITSIPRTTCRDDIVTVRVPVAQQPSAPSTQQDVGPPFKKIRLGETKPDLQQPLRIDVREPPTAYTPQVEAISPTLPSSEDIALRATKEDLLQQINKVDREIAKTEQQIIKLKSKQRELEEAASKPVVKKEEKEAEQPKHQSPAQKIYAENRKKAQEAHALLDKLGPKIEVPLYNQPSDTSVYHENKRRHLTFKKRLIEYLKQQASEKQSYDKYLTVTYSKLMSEWLRKVDKIENSAKRKAKEAKNREFFEKVFPELRKQREDKERFNRVGARIKSDADLEEIMDGLQEQEMEDKKMRSYAVIPPILLDSRQRRLKYVNNNGKLENFTKEYKERQLLNFWTTSEHEIFKEKYLQHPKNFGLIASYLDRKSVCDCVQRYYHSKKQENYKQLLRKSRHGRTRSSRNNPNAKVNNASAASATNLVDAVLSTTGVTTRLQREQLQKQEPKETTNHVILSDSLICSSGSSIMINATTVVTTVSSNAITFSNSSSNSANKEPDKDVSAAQSSAIQAASLSAPATASSAADNKENKISDAKAENKKEKRRKGDKKKEEVETSDEELAESVEKGGAHPCVICKATIETFAHSRPLPRSHASQYGIAEEDIPAGGRVCNTCRCKAVRSRCTTCPMPTCPNAKGRVKRLRALPNRWAELPAEVKDPIILEFQIPPTLTKCCSACFNRISRRLAPHVAPEEEALRWSEEELDALRRALKEHGTSWSKVSEKVATKTHHQCKNFYFNCRKKLGLDLLVQEYNKAHLGEDRKPALTDEEESGSSTSSCDELPIGAHDSSDTASACSPGRAAESVVPTGKDEAAAVLRPPEAAIPVEARPEKDYDSSATHCFQETADEGQGGGDSENAYPHLPGTSITAVPASSQLQHQPQVPQPQPPPPPLPPPPQQQHQLQHQHQPPPPPQQTPQQTQHNGPITSPPRNVKDLMANVIEKTLMKTPGVSVSCSAPPTISSILKTDHRDLPFVKRSTESLATLSIVNSHDRNQGSPSPALSGQAPDLPKEGIVVMQVQQALREPREPEPETLDLSVKRRDSPGGYQNSPTHHFNMPPLSKGGSSSVYQRVGEQHYYPHPHQVSEPNRNASKSPSVFASSPGTPHLVMSHHIRPPHPKIAPLPMIQSKLSPKLVTGPPGAKGGSITHGTPVQGGPRYDGLLRHVAPQPTLKEGGSITQGTPVHHGSHLGPSDKRQPINYDYFKRSSPAGNPSPVNPGQPVSSSYPYGSSPSQPSTTSSSGFSSPYPPNAGRQPTSYPIEQQLSSRQIIMNDYITSQQMHGSRRVPMPTGNDKQDSPSPRGGVGISSPLYYNSPPGGMYLTSRSPVDSSTPPPLRQGVIQRHNTIPASQHYSYSQGQSRPPSGGSTSGKTLYPPPGHEAFSSLVEAAVQQPSLPVPSSEKRSHAVDKPHIAHRDVHHEGLGKTMVDSLSSSRIIDHQGRVQGSEPGNRLFTEQQRIGEQQRLARQNHERERFAQEQRMQAARDREREREQIQMQQQIQLQRQQQARLEYESRQQQQRLDQQQRLEQQARLEYENKTRIEQHRMENTRMEQQQQQSRLDYEKQRHQQQLAAFMDAQQRATSEREERDRERERERDREATRIVVGGFQRDRMPRPNSDSPQSRNQSNPNSQSSRTDDSTMTAASLIDAIITHQINQSSSETGHTGAQAPGPPSTRVGDRLFQSFHRDGPPQQHVEANGKVSPMKRVPSPADREPSGGKNVKLGEHIESIITKDFNRSSYPVQLNVPPEGISPAFQLKWKLRGPGRSQKEMEPTREGQTDKGDERQIIRIAQNTSQPSASKTFHEPVSPPEHWGGRYYPEKPSHLSPLDYVKNRIVEVMRTSEDKESEEKSIGGGGGGGGVGVGVGVNVSVGVGAGSSGSSGGSSSGGVVAGGGASGSGGGSSSGGAGSGSTVCPPGSSATGVSAASTVGGKDRSDSPGDMVIDESKQQDSEVSKLVVFNPPSATTAGSPFVPPTSSTYAYPFSALSVHAMSAANARSPTPSKPVVSNPPVVTKDEGGCSQRNSEPAPLLSAQYEPLSDED